MPNKLALSSEAADTIVGIHPGTMCVTESFSVDHEIGTNVSDIQGEKKEMQVDQLQLYFD